MAEPNSDLRVLLLSRYGRLGASSRLRFLDFVPDLERAGISVTVIPFFDDDYLKNLYAGRRPVIMSLAGYYRHRIETLLRRHDYNLIWLEKEALPWVPRWIEAPLLAKTPCVIDFDDAWFHRYDNHHNPVIRRMLGGKLAALVRNAAHVVVGNDYLEAWAKRSGAERISRIPTTVDISRYTVSGPQDGPPVRIGWMGSPSSAAYLKPIGEALREVCADGEATISLVGSGPIVLNGVPMTIFPWQENDEIDRLHGFDIGIMPLIPDKWSEGKCAYKLIQYMAAGLPVVASPVGMNRQVVRHGINGFLASTTGEWIEALDTLKRDQGLRHRMGAEGRRIVEADFSRTKTVSLLIDILRKAAVF